MYLFWRSITLLLQLAVKTDAKTAHTPYAVSKPDVMENTDDDHDYRL